jgi:hypothetical protein
LYLGLVRGFVMEWPDFIYDNGPVVSGMYDGAGFANTCLLQTLIPNPGAIFGFQANNNAGFRVADDFHLKAPGPVTITEIEVFAYQTGSSTTSTITGLYVDITAGDPSLGAPPVPGSPGFGVNLFTAGTVINNSWSNMYRVSDTNLSNATRPIMAVRCILPAPITLTPGLNYWLSYALTGSLASGPFVPPVVILNEMNVGNAKQLTPSGWQTLTNCATPGCGNGVKIPFRLHGDGQTRYRVASGVPGCGAAGLRVGTSGNLGGLMRADIVHATPFALPLIGLEFNPATAPLCWNGNLLCTLGHPWGFTFFGSGWTVRIPVNPNLFGVQIFWQGAELFGAGACPSLPLQVAMTKSIVVTIQD